MANTLKETRVDGDLYVSEKIYKYNYVLGKYTEIGVDAVPATKITLGSIMVGQNLSITPEGVLSSRNYVPATATANGLLTAQDKVKLDTVEEGANNFTLEIADDGVLGGVMIKSDSMILKDSDGGITVNIGNKYIPGLVQIGDNINVTDTGIISIPMAQYDAQVQVNGLMTAADKNKLDNLATVATTGSYNDLSDKPPNIGVFNLKGKIEYPVMIALTDAAVGDVWTISKDYTVPATGETIKAGANYVCVVARTVGSDNWSQFDPSGALDLTKYLAKSEMYVNPTTNTNIVYSGSWRDIIDLGLATQLADGLLSKSDKIRLDNLHDVATTGDYNSLSNKPSLSTVAESGDYNDLINLPTFSTIASTGKYSDLVEKPTYVDGIVPPGTVLLYAGITVPNGYFLCNGAAPKRLDYPELFSAIGTTYGEGTGTTTFNLPNFIDMIPIGSDSSTGETVDGDLQDLGETTKIKGGLKLMYIIKY